MKAVRARQVRLDFAFEDYGAFRGLELVFEEMVSDLPVDFATLSVGVAFHLDQLPEFDQDGRRLPTLGWRSLLRRPAADLRRLSLPGSVVFNEGDDYLELRIGPSPYDLDPRDAANVRDALHAAKLLPI